MWVEVEGGGGGGSGGDGGGVVGGSRGSVGGGVGMEVEGVEVGGVEAEGVEVEVQGVVRKTRGEENTLLVTLISPPRELLPTSGLRQLKGWTK